MKPKTLVPPRQTPLHHILGLTFLIGELGTKSTNPLYAVQVKIALTPPQYLRRPAYPIQHISDAN